MLDVDAIRNEFRDTTNLKPDTKTVVRATYTQSNPSNESHAGGDLVQVYLNLTDDGEWIEIGTINFTLEDGEPKVKTLEIDITGKIISGLNQLRLVTQVDNNFVVPDSFSESRFTLRVKGTRKINNTYKADLPFRHVDDIWWIYS